MKETQIEYGEPYDGIDVEFSRDIHGKWTTYIHPHHGISSAEWARQNKESLDEEKTFLQEEEHQRELEKDGEYRWYVFVHTFTPGQDNRQGRHAGYPIAYKDHAAMLEACKNPDIEEISRDQAARELRRVIAARARESRHTPPMMADMGIPELISLNAKYTGQSPCA